MKSLYTTMILLLIAVVFCTVAEAGGKEFSASDLKGTYYFVTNQVRMDRLPGGDPQLNYCSGFGTASFDGISTMTVSSTDRCSLTGTTVDSGTQTYAVNPDGSFTTTETAAPFYSTHCKIAGRGRTLLCDGTLSGPDALTFFLVATQE